MLPHSTSTFWPMVLDFHVMHHGICLILTCKWVILWIWFFKHDGNVMQDTASCHNGADSVRTHANFCMENMEPSLKYPKGSLYQAPGLFVGDIEVLLLSCLGVEIWCHQKWTTSIATVT